MFDRAADSVSGLADSLNSTDPAQMLGDVRRFARRQPGAFLGLSALAGFAAVRFLRAGSASSSDMTRSGSYGMTGTTRPTGFGDRAAVAQTGAANPDHHVGMGAKPVSGTGTGAASSGNPGLSGGRTIGGSYD
jgi:hypothetical protein